MSKSEKTKAVALVRTASLKQTASSTALTSQKHQINNYANSHNIEIVNWVEINDDKHVFLRTFDACYTNESVTKLLVSDVTRITRSLEDFAFWRKELRAIGVEIISTNLASPTGDVSTELMQNFMVVIAEYQRIFKSDQVKRGLENRKLRLSK